MRAGLGLVAAVGALKAHAPLQTRVGIATRLVVVGDLIESGEAKEHGIVRETPNLAARLQGVAEPSAVVIAESTRRLLGNLFKWGALATAQLSPGSILAGAFHVNSRLAVRLILYIIGAVGLRDGCHTSEGSPL